MDDARDDIGRRIVEAARLAVWLHLQAEQDAQSVAGVSETRTVLNSGPAETLALAEGGWE